MQNGRASEPMLIEKSALPAQWSSSTTEEKRRAWEAREVELMDRYELL